MIKLNLDFLNKMINTEEVFSEYEMKVKSINQELKDKKGPGAEMTGWMEYPFHIKDADLEQMADISKIWNKKEIKNILLIGIGGSYLGTRAAIDICTKTFGADVKFYYLQNVSSSYIAELYDELSQKDFGLVIISKSGTTLEPALGLRVFYKLLLEKFGAEGAKERVIAVTDANKGTLLDLARKNQWKTFYIPDDIGGRFSAMTPVGLLPCALAGIDVKEIVKGLKAGLKDSDNPNLKTNDCYKYAVLRNYLNKKMKKDIEVFSTYEPRLFYFSEHLKQLFSESEGKDEKGIFPVTARLTTDLHSIGQLLQQGKKNFFETTLLLKKPAEDIKVWSLFNDEDGLDYINGKMISDINNTAAISTIEAHAIDGMVPSIIIDVPELSAYYFGYLYAWFSKALAMSARLLGVNPFNQPGVEAYKKRMFTRLGKK